MVLLFYPSLFCALIPMAVNAEICGGTSGQPCNASVVYTTFESVYLAASTSNLTLRECVRLERNEGLLTHITFKFENGTLDYEDTDMVAFTTVPDVVMITFGKYPDTTYEVQIPFGDYESCYVAKYDNATLGCRLWISNNRTGAQIEECMNGLAQVCSGTVYDTWNEEVCV